MGLSSTQLQALSRSERLSAVADGESSDDLPSLLAAFSAADKDAWSAYHLIGDALRSDELVRQPGSEAAFMAGFATRFAAEPHLLAPAARYRALGRIAALRRRALPAVAIAAAAATLTWVLIPQLQGPLSGAPQLAGMSADPALRRVTVAALPGNAPQPFNVIRDASLDQYLQAHQQFAPDPVVQGSMSYIRASATPDGQ